MESILPRESPRRAGHTAARGHLLIENSDESQPALAKKERSEEASLIASAPPRWSSTRRLCGRGCSLASTAATPTGTRTIFPRYPGSARAATARRASGTVHPQTWAPPGAPPRGGRRARGGAPRGSRSAAAFPNPDARGGRTARRGRRSLARRRPRSHRTTSPFKWRWGGTSRSNAEPRARRRPPPSAASPSRCSNANTPRGLPRRTATSARARRSRRPAATTATDETQTHHQTNDDHGSQTRTPQCTTACSRNPPRDASALGPETTTRNSHTRRTHTTHGA